ncbi:MAG: antibiotic biosynthesis monooxygenase [Flavobacteriales bacterium]|jgi:heme-degrading monooxygenase HmoA|nr:antibiotic biosynthesis monooxygenase [Flavobacteriales bacterium]
MTPNLPTPYYVVIFTSEKLSNIEGYDEVAAEMEELAKQQPGYLGMDFVSGEMSVTMSYWKDEASILHWKRNADHLMAQKMGREKWYKSYTTQVARVERAYNFIKPE